MLTSGSVREENKVNEKHSKGLRALTGETQVVILTLVLFTLVLSENVVILLKGISCLMSYSLITDVNITD